MKFWTKGALVGFLIWLLSIIALTIGIPLKSIFFTRLFFTIHFFPTQLCMSVAPGPGGMLCLFVGPALNIVLFPIYGIIIALIVGAFKKRP